MFVHIKPPTCLECGGEGVSYHNTETGEQGIQCTRCSRRTVTVPARNDVSGKHYTSDGETRLTF